MKNKALGRGLRALIPEIPVAQAGTKPAISFLRVNEIRANSHQPREQVDPVRLQELADSIRAKGLMQPVVVRRTRDGFELIAGERRLRAEQSLGYTEVPAIVREHISDRESLELSLLENVQRDNLNPVEEACAYQRLADEFNLSHDVIAHAVGKNRSTIANAVRLLRLPKLMLDAVRSGVLTMGHAKALLTVEDEREQRQLFDDLLARGGSVREAELKAARVATHRRTRKLARDPEVVNLEEALAKTLGTRVRIMHGRRRGRIIIEYYTLDDLERIRHAINGQRVAT